MQARHPMQNKQGPGRITAVLNREVIFPPAKSIFLDLRCVLFLAFL